MKRAPTPEYIAQLSARLADAKASASRAARAQDTRRKILLGALLLEALERGTLSPGTQAPVVLRALASLPILKEKDRAFLAASLPSTFAPFFGQSPR